MSMVDIVWMQPSMNMYLQSWIYNKSTQPGCMKLDPRFWFPSLSMYKSNHVSKFLEDEHGRNHLITGQWCEILTSVRETTSNVNGSQNTLYNPWNVNEWAKFQHVTESFNQRSMMQPIVEGKKPAIEACRFQGINDF